MISRISLLALLTLALAVPAAFTQQAPLQKVTINYPARSGGSWPLFIAKEGGYYQKYGLDVTLEFGAGNIGVAMISSGQAVMTNSSMEQALQASSRAPTELVSIGSFLNKGVFALMAAKNITSIKELKGKRIAVAQVGDADMAGITCGELSGGHVRGAEGPVESAARIQRAIQPQAAVARPVAQRHKARGALAAHPHPGVSLVFVRLSKCRRDQTRH